MISWEKVGDVREILTFSWTFSPNNRFESDVKRLAPFHAAQAELISETRKGNMDLDLVPILADSIKGYYEDNELVELCDLYDIDLDFDGGKPAYMRLARDLIREKIGDVLEILTFLRISWPNTSFQPTAYSGG